MRRSNLYRARETSKRPYEFQNRRLNPITHAWFMVAVEFMQRHRYALDRWKRLLRRIPRSSQ